MGLIERVGKLCGFLLLFVCVSIVVILATKPISDSDLWLHMLYGKYILKYKTLVVDHTVFSWTPSTNEIIYCAWIPQIIFYLVYDFFGFNGIFTLRYLILFLCYGFVFYYLYRLNLLTNPVALLIVVIGHFHAHIGFVDKATLFSMLYLYFTLFLYFYLSWKREFNPRLFYLFPLIMLIWVNSHGYFLFGCIIYACLFVGEILNIVFYPHLSFKREYRLHFFFAMILSAIVIFITPYGYEYIYQLFYINILGKYDPIFHSTIAEYQEYFKSFNLGKIVFPNLSLIILIVLILLNLKKKTINLNVITLNLFATFIFTKYERTSVFWGPVLIFTGIYLLYVLRLNYNESRNYFRGGRYANYAVNMIAFMIMSLIFYYLLFHERCQIKPLGIMSLNEGVIYDREAIDYIRKNLLKYKCGNSYITGSILAFEFWPELKVMIDARQFPYQRFYGEYHEFDNDPDNSDLLRKYQIDYYVLSTFNLRLVDWFSKSPDWKLVFLGKNMWIFVRKDLYLPLENHKIAENALESRNVYKLLHLYNYAITYLGSDFSSEVIKRYKAIDKNYCEIYKVYEGVLDNSFKAEEYFLNRDYKSTINSYLKIPLDLIQNHNILADSLLKFAEKAISQSDFSTLIKCIRIYYAIPTKDDYNLIMFLWYIKENLNLENLPDDIKNLVFYLEFYKNIYVSKMNLGKLLLDRDLDTLYQIANKHHQNDSTHSIKFKYHSNPVCPRP